jgi:hypothetical protein
MRQSGGSGELAVAAGEQSGDDLRGADERDEDERGAPAADVLVEAPTTIGPGTDSR